jgi:hypothetical protein
LPYNVTEFDDEEKNYMPVYKTGDTVRIIARDQEPADIKSQLYYPHYAGLKGAILKLYGEEASVLIERETLPAEVRTRHVENERAMRQRWLDGLSEEGRNRLSAKEKEFGLNYAVLVALKDVEPAKPGVDSLVSSAGAETKRPAREVAKTPAAIDPATAESAAAEAKRVTVTDLDAAEAEFLNKLQDRATSD